ncbi:MAG: molecular chaperone TorD family protein [Usitatibacter sp.]
MSAQPVTVQRPLPPEESARADFYALLARLVHDAPDSALLAGLACAGSLPVEGDAALAKAWDGLVKASGAMDHDAATEEFEKLFIGIGKCEVSAYAGFYGGAPSIDHPRVRIQADLAALGLAHRRQVTEPEDHYAGLFEVMRVLVAGGAGRAPGTVAEQKHFYAAHVEPGASRFFRGLGAAASANYYRHVAAVGQAFISLESESFQLD